LPCSPALASDFASRDQRSIWRERARAERSWPDRETIFPDRRLRFRIGEFPNNVVLESDLERRPTASVIWPTHRLRVRMPLHIDLADRATSFRFPDCETDVLHGGRGNEMFSVWRSDDVFRKVRCSKSNG